MERPAYHPFQSAEAKERYLEMYDRKAKEWLVDSEARMVNTAFGQTFVRISGPASAPPLVLLPGWGANSLSWMPNIEALSEPFKTHAVDRIDDYGRSVYTRELTSADDLVNWLDELFTALDLGDDINLMGLSYGGWLTSQYALRCPNRLDKVVLLAPAATVLPISKRFMVQGLLQSLVPIRAIKKNYFHWWAADSVQKDQASREFLYEMMDDMALAERCFKPKRGVAPTVLEDEEWQSIQVPTLFLVGENEKLYPAQKAVQRLNKVAPQIRTEVIPNAGHDLTWVQADAVNSKVLEFLKQA